MSNFIDYFIIFDSKYLEPHWFWNGLKILLLAAGVAYGIVLTVRWLKERAHRSEDQYDGP